MQLSKRIQAWRKHAGITQQHLADILGVARTTVSMWETGDSTPSRAVFDMLVATLTDSSHVKFYGKVPK